MRILVLSTHDYRGGAGKVAYNMASSFRKKGHDVLFYVKYKSKNKKWILESKTNIFIKKIKHLLDYLPHIILKNKNDNIFSLQFFGEDLSQLIKDFKPDIINIHWVGKGFISYQEISKISNKIPTVYTCHDHSFFSGGFSFTPDKKKSNLTIKLKKLLALINQKRIKKLTFKKLYLVSPSNDVKKLITKKSHVKRVTVINNGVKIKQIKNNKKENRIAFGAINLLSDQIKGFEQLKKLIENNKEYIESKGIKLTSFGNENPFEKNFKNIKTKKEHLGLIKSKNEINEILNKSKIFILPSLGENYSMLAVESITNKTPILAFDVGGNKEIIKHKKNGYLAMRINSQDFSQGFIYLLENQLQISDKDIKIFDISKQTNKYLDLFKIIIER